MNHRKLGFRSPIDLVPHPRNIVTRNGAEAIVLASQHVPDAVILDMMMLAMDGRRFSACCERRSPPVAMLTARKQESDIVDAFGLGASDDLIEPVIPQGTDDPARLLAGPK